MARSLLSVVLVVFASVLRAWADTDPNQLTTSPNDGNTLLKLSPINATQFAFALILALITVYQIIATIVLLFRPAEGTTRGPFLSLILALFALVASYILQAAFVASFFSLTNPCPTHSLAVATDVMSRMVDVLVAAAVMHIINNRRGYHGFRDECQITCLWNSHVGFDGAILLTLLISVICISVVNGRLDVGLGVGAMSLGGVYEPWTEGTVDFGGHQETVRMVFYHIYVAAYFAAGLDVIITSVSLWMKVSRTQVSPENAVGTIVCVISPLFFARTVYKVVEDIIQNLPPSMLAPISPNSFRQPSPNTWFLIDILVGGILYAVVIFLFINAGTVPLTMSVLPEGNYYLDGCAKPASQYLPPVAMTNSPWSPGFGGYGGGGYASGGPTPIPGSTSYYYQYPSPHTHGSNTP
ncbi:hypothetical protein BDN72DRAFT_842340 [Pluteus cervinus]|uniref:Uncharacterized protein n=1 Tax=Pluteus cervinus TaxID=181527 RepID=A0ACD3ARV8_9AGAR|nr:hypothetical protein BDN72DRAFT_842340 [Pluteus cervinus]